MLHAKAEVHQSIQFAACKLLKIDDKVESHQVSFD